MKVRLYTDEEIKKLKDNMFVKDIKYKREISYDPIFKLWSIMMRLEFPELSAREIFSRGGFDVEILNRNLPQRRINDWLNNYKSFGVNYFLPQNEYYSTIRKSNKKRIDLNYKMKTKILEFVLQKLKELEHDNR